MIVINAGHTFMEDVFVNNYSNSATWLCLLVTFVNKPPLWSHIIRTIKLLYLFLQVLLLRLT